jgi:hypothetical protein
MIINLKGKLEKGTHHQQKRKIKKRRGDFLEGYDEENQQDSCAPLLV